MLSRNKQEAKLFLW